MTDNNIDKKIDKMIDIWLEKRGSNIFIVYFLFSMFFLA